MAAACLRIRRAASCQSTPVRRPAEAMSTCRCALASAAMAERLVARAARWTEGRKAFCCASRAVLASARRFLTRELLFSSCPTRPPLEHPRVAEHLNLAPRSQILQAAHRFPSRSVMHPAATDPDRVKGRLRVASCFRVYKGVARCRRDVKDAATYLRRQMMTTPRFAVRAEARAAAFLLLRSLRRSAVAQSIRVREEGPPVLGVHHPGWKQQ